MKARFEGRMIDVDPTGLDEKGGQHLAGYEVAIATIKGKRVRGRLRWLVGSWTWEPLQETADV